MLVQNTALTRSDIVSLKFNSGEELVGKFVHEDANSITLEGVLVPHLMAHKGQGVIQFAPFMVGMEDDEKVIVQRDRLMVKPLKTRKEFADAYKRATSKLDLPAQPAIVTP